MGSAFRHWLQYVAEEEMKLTRNEQLLLDGLHDAKAFTEESAIENIPLLLENLARANGMGKSALYNALRGLLEKSMVETKKMGKAVKGQPNSKVWLRYA